MQKLKEIADICRLAGKTVMQVYESGNFEIEHKVDNSPLTLADKQAHEIITDELENISNYQIISEEGSIPLQVANVFWLVDPIDGTKEFIKKNGEFTINIGLIENGRPVLGVVYAPAKDVMYMGSEHDGSWKQIGDNKLMKISAEFHGDHAVIVASKSHRDDKVDAFLNRFDSHKEINMGSSLKLCLVAEGIALAYPRFAPTCLWDTAAADAIVRAAGGFVFEASGEKQLEYNLSNIKNPHFVAHCKNIDDFTKFSER